MSKTTTIHNKLVRDNIPDIIKQNGNTCRTRTLERREFVDCLITKLIEETNEFAEHHTIEELVDMYTVLHALMKATFGFHEIAAAATTKRVKNGAFENQVFLISTESGTDA